MASGDLLAAWGPRDGLPPSTNYARHDTRNGHPVLNFKDATANERIVFEDCLPPHYSAGGITLEFWFVAATATTGDVIFSAAFERLIEGGHDIDADSFATEQVSAAATANGTSGILTKGTISFTDGQIDGLLAGENYRCYLERKQDNGSDTMAGDAQLRRVKLKET